MPSQNYDAFIYFQKVILKAKLLSLRNRSGMDDLSPLGRKFNFTQVNCISRSLLSETGTTVVLVYKLLLVLLFHTFNLL